MSLQKLTKRQKRFLEIIRLRPGLSITDLYLGLSACYQSGGYSGTCASVMRLVARGLVRYETHGSRYKLYITESDEAPSDAD